MQEMDHLEKISERIYLLEGEATYKPDPLPVVGDTAQDFFTLRPRIRKQRISALPPNHR